jgi:hypothetical protein
MPELYPMEIAILRHCFERKVKVFTITFFAQATPIIDLALNKVKEEYPDIKSGVDYCNFGFKPISLPVVLGMGENISTAIDTDAEGRKIATLPIMKDITNYNEMNLVVETSGSAAGGMWITYARVKFGVNVAIGVTAVMAADEYPYLQTGQVTGMLSGLKGAAEYEKLVDVFAAYRDETHPHGRPFSSEILREKDTDKLVNITTQKEAVYSPQDFQKLLTQYPASAPILNQLKQERDGNIVINVYNLTQDEKNQIGVGAMQNLQYQSHNILYKFKTARIGMNAQSVAHIMIIVFIIIGNIGYFLQKKRQAAVK